VTDDTSGADRKSGACEDDSDGDSAAVEPWVIDLLACPVDRNPVQLDKAELVCVQCGRRYPVLAGIPRMVPDQVIGEQKF